jgi:hypothetical protein
LRCRSFIGNVLGDLARSIKYRYNLRMQSKIATAAKNALIASTERLSPEERLNAFLAHSRLLVELHAAGARLRSDAISVEGTTRRRPLGKLL